MSAEIKQPELRAADKRGNVRPADDRYLSKSDQRKQAAYVEKVKAAEAERDRREAPEDDPYADTIGRAVRNLAPAPTEDESSNG